MANDFQGQVHFGEPDAPVHYRIKSLTNLIPIEIEYEENGESKTITGYMDYANQAIKVPPDMKIEDKEGFLQKVIDFMANRTRKAQADAMPQGPSPDVMDNLMRKAREMEHQQQQARKHEEKTNARKAQY